MALYATPLAEPSPRCVHCGGFSAACATPCLARRRCALPLARRAATLSRHPLSRTETTSSASPSLPAAASRCGECPITHWCLEMLHTHHVSRVTAALKTSPSPAGLYLGKKLGLTPPGYDDFKAIQYCSDIVDAFEGGVGKNNEDTHRGPLQAPRRTAPRRGEGSGMARRGRRPRREH